MELYTTMLTNISFSHLGTAERGASEGLSIQDQGQGGKSRNSSSLGTGDAGGCDVVLHPL